MTPFNDLPSRSKLVGDLNPGSTPPGTLSGVSTRPTGHPLDPDSYSDEERPPGWYIVPEAPWKMPYWSGYGPEAGWNRKTAKTPKEDLANWYGVADG